MWIYISIIVLVCLIFYGYYQTMLKRKQNDELAVAFKKKKAIFITGCDTGFGYSLILHNLSNLVPENDRILIAGCYYPNGRSEGNINHFVIRMIYTLYMEINVTRF